ncbi:MAG TPA: hypothetical protein VLO30_01125, partial [Chthoniobacterales bacterium]|nr:hypothetical protein [Chthoniobacterales bacterium]
LFLVQFARRTWTTAKHDSAPAFEISGSIPEKSIAVLPFSNLSAEQENAFFTDGIQEEILADLAKVSDLKVISRSSVTAYKAGNPRNAREIGQQLGVAHLLEGSVQRTKDRVRVTAQLIDARTDDHQWAEHYDRGLADVFAIQTEIAQAITHQLEAKLSSRERAAIEPSTRDIGAFDLYLRAKELIKNFHDTPNWKETLLHAVRLLDEAIVLDPNFALAYCWRTTAHDSLYWHGLDRTQARVELAQASAQKALALIPDLGEAHLAQALVYYHEKRDYSRAFEELALANRTLPNSAEVFYLAGSIAGRQAHWDDAVRNLEKAFALDPLNPKTVNALSLIYDLLCRYDDEEALFARAAEANPTQRNFSQLIHAQIELEKGDLKAAHSFLTSLPPDYDPDGATTWTRLKLALYERDARLAGSVLASWKKEELVGGAGTMVPVSYWHGVIARTEGDSSKANEAFMRARETIAAQLAAQRENPLLLATLGLIDAGLSRKEEAVREGRRAVALRPLTDDAVDGATVLSSMAMIYAWVGDVNGAMEQLAFLAKTPGGPPYGQLKYDPDWDAVRADPRFEPILNDLQPRAKESR